MTTAADSITAAQIEDAGELRKAILAQQTANTEVTEKAKTLMKGSARIQVNVGDADTQLPRESP
jgi:hypothetical protein